jgi:hypothetical protein
MLSLDGNEGVFASFMSHVFFFHFVLAMLTCSVESPSLYGI